MNKSSDETEVQYAIEEAISGDYKSLISRFGFKRSHLALVREMIKVDAGMYLTIKVDQSDIVSNRALPQIIE